MKFFGSNKAIIFLLHLPVVDSMLTSQFDLEVKANTGEAFIIKGRIYLFLTNNFERDDSATHSFQFQQPQICAAHCFTKLFLHFIFSFQDRPLVAESWNINIKLKKTSITFTISFKMYR